MLSGFRIPLVQHWRPGLRGSRRFKQNFRWHYLEYGWDRHCPWCLYQPDSSSEFRYYQILQEIPWNLRMGFNNRSNLHLWPERPPCHLQGKVPSKQLVQAWWGPWLTLHHIWEWVVFKWRWFGMVAQNLPPESERSGRPRMMVMSTM